VAGAEEPKLGGSSGNDLLGGVAATSATNAWAVGYSAARTLVDHWNGKAWKLQASPHPAVSFSDLASVAATSRSNAWAVGYYADSGLTPSGSLIEHWNGSTWQMQVSPNPGAIPQLVGMAVTSPADAWAVGFYANSGGAAFRTLVEHWN
jgi:hypothetical protein